MQGNLKVIKRLFKGLEDLLKVFKMPSRKKTNAEYFYSTLVQGGENFKHVFGSQDRGACFCTAPPELLAGRHLQGRGSTSRPKNPAAVRMRGGLCCFDVG